MNFRTIIALVGILTSVRTFAQDFFVENELDTIMPIFATNVENDAYDIALCLPRAYGADTGFVSTAPLAVRFWSPRQGWDVLVFDVVERTTFAQHLDFSGEYSDNVDKNPLLVALTKKKCPK